MTFKPFHDIFVHAAIFVSIEVTVDDSLFATTVCADKPDDLIPAITRGLFEDGEIEPEQQAVLDYFAESLSNEKLWLWNSLTNAPMRAKIAHVDDNGEVLITVFVVTDTNTVPDVDRQNVDDIPGQSLAMGVLQTVMTMNAAARQNDGVAFIGYVEKKAMLDILSYMSVAADHYGYCQMVSTDSTADEFPYEWSEDNMSVAIEATFDSKLFEDFGQEVLSANEHVASAEQNGAMFVQLYGQRDVVFNLIGKGAHALLAIRPLKPSHE